jgi:YD repeat-containing protein
MKRRSRGIALFLFVSAIGIGMTFAQTASYHLHSEASSTSGLFQLKSAGPDTSSSTVLSVDLKNLAIGEYVVKQFDTQSGNPNSSGVIPSGSTLTFNLWMRKTANKGTMFPRAKVNLNGAAGTSLCVATGTTALTTTLAQYAISCNTAANVTMTATDRLYLWVGINLTGTSNQSFNAELDIEGTSGGNYDSQLAVPLPTPAPTLTGLTPNSGAVGSAISIVGTNFRSVQGSNTVTFFNGKTASVTSWSDTTVLATVPTGATTGSAVVTVGGQASNGSTFTVTPAPSISSLSRTSGAVGAVVTITGNNFGATQGNGTVKFNGTLATVTTWSNTSIATSVPTGATNGNVVVAAAGGVASNGLSFTVLPAPSIGTLSPTSGAAGTPVSIGGSNFGTQGSGTVTFNGVLATPTSWNASSIGTTVPVGATTGNVVVNASGVASNGVVFTVPPVITGVSPTSGSIGTPVTISGSSFGATQGSSTVTFNGVAASVLNWSDTSVIASVPAGTGIGPRPAVLTVAGVGSNSLTFTVTPGISRISPSAAPIGATVNVRGTNFGSTQGSSTVTFNGVSVTPVTWTDTSIVATVPSGVTTGPVVVTVGTYASNATTFTVASSVSSISPISGSSGTPVTITGLNFGATQGTSTVLFNGLSGAPTNWSNTSIVVPVPNGASTGPVTVVVGGGASNGLIFIVAPVISSISPTAGTPGTSVVIAGSGFGTIQGAGGLVAFNGTYAPVLNWTNTKINATVPTGASTGPVVVTVNSVASNGLQFSIGNGTLAGIVSNAGNSSAISGALVQALQANTVVGNATTVADGSYSIPNLPAGSYDLRVTATGFGTTIQSANAVTANTTTTVNVALGSPGTLSGNVTQADGITAISGGTITAQQGATSVGTATTDTSGHYSIATLSASSYSVQATATGYTGQTQSAVTVTSGNTTTANFNLAGQSVITYTYDELGRLVGTVDSLSDAVSYQYDAVGNLLSIARNHSNQTSIIDFTPKDGPVGTTVTISGTAFSATPSQDSVSFNGTSATVTSATQTQIIATVPSGATTGTITVVAPSGTATSTNAFTMTSGGNGAPTITSFAPTSGVPTTAVTVTGTNFDTNKARNSLRFNLSPATISSAAASSLSTTVPALVASGPISVVTPFGNATSAQDFFVPFGSHAVADIGFTGRMSLNGTQTISIGTAGRIGLMLFDATAGQKTSIFANNSTFSSCNLLFIDPYGRQITNMPCTGTGHFSGAQAIAYTGTYTIGIDPAVATGTVSINLNGFSDLTGVLIPGVPSTITTSYPGQTAIYSFAGTAGQLVSLAATNSTFSCGGMTFSILKPDGTLLASNGWCVPPSLNNQTLPVTGTYTLLVNPGANTGSATFTLTQNITQAIAFNTPKPVSSTLAGQVFNLTFAGTAGQVVSLAATNNSYPCNGLNFSILKPDGSSLSSIGTCGAASLNNQTLPATGNYTVLVNPGGNTGGATFTLTQNISQAIAFNSSQVVSSTFAGQVFDLTFGGTAGQVVSVGETTNTYPCNSTAMTFSILKPDGTSLANNTTCINASFNNQTLPTTGTYTILVNSHANTGGATFTLTQNISQAIAFNTPLNVSSTLAGQVFDLTFSGAAGQIVSAAATNNTYSCFGTTFSILKPDGTSLANFIHCGNSSLNNQTLPSTGTYTVLVNPGSNTGGATFTLTQNISQALASNTPLTVSSTLAGQVFDLTFSGTAGQLVNVAATNNTYPCAGMTFSILKPDGTSLASASPCGNGSLNNQTLPTTGTYTVLVNPGGNTGGATFTLSP